MRAALAVPPQALVLVVADNHDRIFKLITWEDRGISFLYVLAQSERHTCKKPTRLGLTLMSKTS